MKEITEEQAKEWHRKKSGIFSRANPIYYSDMADFANEMLKDQFNKKYELKDGKLIEVKFTDRTCCTSFKDWEDENKDWNNALTPIEAYSHKNITDFLELKLKLEQSEDQIKELQKEVERLKADLKQALETKLNS